LCGSGSSTHLATQLFKVMAGVQIVHVPYKGVVPAATDLVSGQVQMRNNESGTAHPSTRAQGERSFTEPFVVSSVEP
jgi:tripartite-type tricarboxylate transporter receptor subunit TctC